MHFYGDTSIYCLSTSDVFCFVMLEISSGFLWSSLSYFTMDLLLEIANFSKRMTIKLFLFGYAACWHFRTSLFCAAVCLDLFLVLLLPTQFCFYCASYGDHLFLDLSCNLKVRSDWIILFDMRKACQNLRFKLALLEIVILSESMLDLWGFLF